MKKTREVTGRRSFGLVGPHLCALILLATHPGAAEAQLAGTVRGVVTDASRSVPLRNIEVRVTGTRQITLTDGQGAYQLSQVPPGTRTIEFSWIGYESHQAEIDVVAGQVSSLDVALAPAPLPIGEVRVTAVSRQPERVVESPAAVSVVPPARIRALRGTGQTPLLIRDLPGIYVMQSGITGFNVNSRAFNTLVNRRMLVLVDGVDASVPLVGAQEWPAVSIFEEGSRVELVRGPGSALYGANAFSGVLNIVTPSVRQSQGTRLTVAGGDPLTLRVEGRHGLVSSDLRWGVRVRGEYARSRSWDRARTNLGDLAAEYDDVVDASEVMAPAPGFELRALDGQSVTTVPGPATGTPSPEVVSRGSVRVDHYLEGGGVVTAEGGLTVAQNQVGDTGANRLQTTSSTTPWARLAWATDDVNVMAYYTARTGEAWNLASGQQSEDWSSRFHVEGQGTLRFWDGRGSVVGGASLRSEKVDSKGSILAPEHDGRVDQFYGLFTQATVEVVSGIRVLGAMRVDDSSLFDVEFSPKVGVVWSATEDQSLRLTFGRAYLIPSAAERFLRFALGPPIDLSALEAGLRASPLGPALAGVPNGELLTMSAAVPALAIGFANRRPQESTGLELGYKGQLDRVYIGVDVHRTEFSDFMTGLLPGVHPDFAPWTAPAAVPAAAVDAVETAVRDAVPGITRLEDGTTGLVFSLASAGRAIQWGADITAGVRVTDRIEVDGNYSYVVVDFDDGSFLGADSVPTNTPTHIANLGVSYESPGELSLRVGLRLVDGFNFRSALLNGRVPGRQTVDVSAYYPLSRQIAASLSVTNLFDQKRYHFFGGSLVRRRAVVTLTWDP